MLIGFWSFAIAVAFIPGVISGATVPRWAIIALAPLFLLDESRRKPLQSVHYIGLAFLAWCLLSFTWSAAPLDGIDEMAQLLICAAVFVLGGRLYTMRPVYIGMGLGLWVSSAVIIIQRFFDPFIVWPGTASAPSGIFINADTAAEIAALVMVGAFVHRIYWLIPGLLPAVILCKGRSVWVAVGAVAILWTWRRSKPAAIGIIALGIGLAMTSYFVGFKLGSTLQRIEIYVDTLQGMTFWGHGLGSFRPIFPYYATHIDTFHLIIENAHSDLLEYWFDLGPGALLLFGVFAIALSKTEAIDHLVLVCFTIEATLGFPSHLPATAFLAACVAGFLCKGRDSVRDIAMRWGVLLQRKLLAKIGN